MRDRLKAAARGLSLVAAVPALLSFAVRRRILGADRALETSMQLLSLLPGLPGAYVRTAFLRRTLAYCAPSAQVEFGTLLSRVGARLEDNVYIGPRCHLGLVHLERDVLLAAGVHIPSGRHTHGTSDVDVPIREQPGTRTTVHVGEGTWIGSAAIVLADVGRRCVVAAGAVVTSPLPDDVVAAGVPARVVKHRRSGTDGS